jgi:type IV pilus assembly protein PilC
MPRFAFEATDGLGQRLQGTLDASTENELVTRLASQGLRVVRLSLDDLAMPAPVAVPQPSRPSVPARAAPASNRVVRTKKVGRMALSFLFANLANLNRAGIGPADVFSTLAQRVPQESLKEVLRQAAQGSSQGQSIADSLARFPDVFPPGAVGAVRAGEVGGYFPEACQRLSRQFENDHRAAWIARLARYVVFWAVLAVPWALAMMVTMQKFTGTMLNDPEAPITFEARMEFMFREFWREMARLPGWIVLGFVVCWFVGRWWLRQTSQRHLRHRLALAVPPVARYGRLESLDALSWHMGKLMHAGIHPGQAYALAADAVPNLEFAWRAKAALAGARESTPLGQIVAASGLFPPDHVSLIQTGEMAGSLPEALDQSARLSAAEQDHMKPMLRFGIIGAALVLMWCLAGFAVVKFYHGFYSTLVDEALETGLE